MHMLRRPHFGAAAKTNAQKPQGVATTTQFFKSGPHWALPGGISETLSPFLVRFAPPWLAAIYVNSTHLQRGWHALQGRQRLVAGSDLECHLCGAQVGPGPPARPHPASTVGGLWVGGGGKRRPWRDRHSTGTLAVHKHAKKHEIVCKKTRIHMQNAKQTHS